jgi:hypothetical protein
MPGHGYPAVALSRPYGFEPERDCSPVVRCARVAAALVAVLALRALLSGSEHAARWHLATPWVLIVAAFGAGVMLREAGRGLVSQLPRPRWSAMFAVTWAGSSGLLLTALLTSGGSLGFGAWISIPLAVGLGLVLTTSLHGARRLLWCLARVRGRIPIRVRASAVPIPCALTMTAPVGAPLLAGWSDRGPPQPLS